jgi:hypothetical protein
VPRPKDVVFRNVAVPIEVYDMLRQMAEVDDRSLARELAYLIKEAYAQIIGGRS